MVRQNVEKSRGKGLHKRHCPLLWGRDVSHLLKSVEPKSVIRILVSVHFFLEQVFVLCKGAMRAL